MSKPDNILWGGRFDSEPSEILQKLNSSIEIDKRMYSQDIEGSICYSKAIFEAGLLSREEQIEIEKGLNLILDEWKRGKFQIIPSDEDIHTANERRLKELIGPLGGKLHTGRSRNDQVATDFRMWVMGSTTSMKLVVKKLIQSLVDRAECETDIIMPGYTHLQRAQAIRWSHWLLSHGWSFYNDMSRLENVKKSSDVCPLGSGALAGNPFCINRESLADQLNFTQVTQNSLHAVADRDFVAEYLFWACLIACHLSKLAEDLILYSSSEFGFIKLSDNFATGSSLMPQKKNPDGLELIRGKAGKLIANLTNFVCILKSLPSTYNKDLQDDKELIFNSLDTIESMVAIAAGTVSTLKINKEKCRQALTEDMLATDLAYYLVRKGVPFREAHEKAGQVVKISEQLKCTLSCVPLAELIKISGLFTEDVADLWSFEKSIEQYTVTGGTSLSSVNKQVEKLRNLLK